MKRIEGLQACTACTVCYNVCPQNCIEMIEDKEGFIYPRVNQAKCFNCKLCENICPELNPVESPIYEKAWYGWSKCEDVRKSSSSGGAFTALARKVIDNCGVVYGAIFDYSSKKVTYANSNYSTIEEMRKSKYVQAGLGNTLRQIKKDLDDGKVVMFVGTPCHVAGVKNFLKSHRNYSKLILCDFICHGVPSPKILKDHLTYLEKIKGAEINTVDFRPKTDKKRPWSVHHLKCIFTNQSIYDKAQRLDWYMRAFIIKNIDLRKSCYECKYCQEQHISDITLADFWGIKQFKPELNDEKGISLIIANTDKGANLITSISLEFNLYGLSWDYAKYVYKPRTVSKYNLEKRNIFFDFYAKNGYEKVMKQFIQKDINKEKIFFFLRKLYLFLNIPAYRKRCSD